MRELYFPLLVCFWPPKQKFLSWGQVLPSGAFSVWVVDLWFRKFSLWSFHVQDPLSSFFCHISTLECGGTFHCSHCVCVCSCAGVGKIGYLQLWWLTWIFNASIFVDLAWRVSVSPQSWFDPEGREEPTGVVGLFSLHSLWHLQVQQAPGSAGAVCASSFKAERGKIALKGNVISKSEDVQTEALPNLQKYCLCGQLLSRLHKAKVLPQT